MTPIQLTPLDVTKPALEILIDKLNALNALTLQASDFVLALPQPWVGVNYDTKISIVPLVTSAWYNAITVYYKRVNLATLFTTQLIVQSNGATHVHDVLESINAVYGIYLTANDVENDTITYHTPGDVTSSATITLSAKTTSPMFSGVVEMTLNLLVDQGISTYDDEQTYYAVVTKNGKDSIKAYNSLGNPMAAFSFLEGATVNACNVLNLTLLPDETLLMIGECNYTTANPIGDPIVTNAVAVKMDLRGNILGVSMGERFGTAAHASYTFDPVEGYFYAIDKNNVLGGVAHRVHRYDTSGVHDNGFVLEGLTDVIDNLTVDATGNLFMVDNTIVGFTLHKRLPDGTIDPDFTPANVTVFDNTAHCSVISPAASGVYVRITDINEHNGTTVVSVNGTPLWSTAFAESRWSPVLKFNTDGSHDTAFRNLRHDRGSSAFGVDPVTLGYYGESYLLSAYNNYVAYGGVRVSPLFGQEVPTVIVLDKDTGMLQDTASDFIGQNLIWDTLAGFCQNKSAEVVAWGVAHTLEADGPTGAAGVIALYSRRGTAGGVFLTLTSSVIKSVLVYAEA